MSGVLRRLTEQERAIRAFVRDGRLVSIPAKPRKRELLLPYLLDRSFPEDREYEEKEVNQRLALLHHDVASLRRYLIDGGLMMRERGVYRRTAPVDPEAPPIDPWPAVTPPRPVVDPSGDARTRARRASGG